MSHYDHNATLFFIGFYLTAGITGALRYVV